MTALVRASSVPAVIDALVAALSAALGPENVNDGQGASATDGTQYVFVGVDDPDSDDYQNAASSSQGWAWLGHQRIDEEITVHCVAVGWNGNADQKAARDSVYAVMKVVADAIVNDPSLGGSALWTLGVVSHDLRQMQDDKGAIAHLHFDVTCKARL